MKFKQFLLISSILLVFFISFNMVNAADNSFNQTLSNSDVETELTIISESPEILKDLMMFKRVLKMQKIMTSLYWKGIIQAVAKQSTYPNQ